MWLRSPFCGRKAVVLGSGERKGKCLTGMKILAFCPFFCLTKKSGASVFRVKVENDYEMAPRIALLSASSSNSSLDCFSLIASAFFEIFIDDRGRDHHG